MSLYPQPYMFFSNKPLKVKDNTGLVHETRPVQGAMYGSRTGCEHSRWDLFEPLCVVDMSEVTTCLMCLGAKLDGVA